MNKAYTWISAIVMFLMFLIIIGQANVIGKIDRLNCLSKELIIVQDKKIVLLELLLSTTSPEFAEYKKKQAEQNKP
jgi:hypothetical protein